MQTVLLCAFAGAFLVDGPWLFVPESFRAAAIVLCGVGLLLMISAFISLGGAIQIAPEPRRGAHLVTTGIYRRFRHPIYTAIVILVVGLFLRNPTVVVAIAAAAVVVFLLIKVRFEERLLLTRYPEYVEYKRRSWGLIPWFRRSPRKTLSQ